MKRFAFFGPLALFATVVLGASGNTPPKNRLTLPDVIANFENSTGLVTCFSTQNDVTSQGSGFFVSEDGEFVTNYHVIAEADHMTVKRSDGAYYSVSGVLAVDTGHDLALVQVAGKRFQPAKLGNSSKLRVGDTAIAVGSPLTLESTASTGIISGFRDLSGFKLIQTTTPISHGSSGGALLNSSGQVVGVTSYGISGGQNLNFAIPVEYVRVLLKTPHQVSIIPPALAPSDVHVDIPTTTQSPLTYPTRQKYEHPGFVSQRYDKFDDVTTFTLSGVNLLSGDHGRLDLGASLGFVGLHLSAPLSPQHKVLLQFFSRHSEPKCQSDDSPPHLILLVDGKRTDLANGRRTASSDPKRCDETIEFETTAGQLVPIAQALRVDGRLGAADFSLQQPELNALLDLASRMAPSDVPDNVEIGQTADQVQSILGKPPAYEGHRDGRKWIEIWKYPGLVVVIADGVVTQIN